MSIKIGIPVPNSNFIPRVGKSIVTSLKLGLNSHPSIEYELFLEATGYNADKRVLEDKINGLILKNEVDIVTAPLNPGLLATVGGIFSGQQLPLIINTLGEDIIATEDTNPYVFANSMNLWQSMWALGYWAVGQYGEEICTLAALHDGGYGMAFAFGLGVEANGGRILQTAITHRNSCTEDPSAEIEMIAKNAPAAIFALYSGKESISFLSAYRQLGYLGQIPLIGGPFMVDDSLLSAAGESALAVHTPLSWSADSDAPENRGFKERYRELLGEAPHVYALLAYETGCLIALAAGKIGGSQASPTDLAEALTEVAIHGPRGAIGFDPGTREVSTRDHLRQVLRAEDGTLFNKSIATLPLPPLFHEQLALARVNLKKQGWLNPYLIA